MKLQKIPSRKIGKKEYAKWMVILPPANIDGLGWQEGQKLKSEIADGNLVIKKSFEPSYEEFKNKVFNLLNSRPSGFIWQEIKDSLGLEIAVPNNRWVRKLEKDISLKRRKEGTTTYWYLEHKGGVVYTIGYEGRNLTEFIDILKKHKIQGLIDVRELPLSRKNGFSKSELSAVLKANQIVYRHIPELGSPREIRHKLWDGKNYEVFFKEYTDWLYSDNARDYLTDLEGLAHVRTSAIMCFERDVEKCHRSIIKKKLVQDDFKVVDL